jgi:hypothetical protein
MEPHKGRYQVRPDAAAADLEHSPLVGGGQVLCWNIARVLRRGSYQPVHDSPHVEDEGGVAHLSQANGFTIRSPLTMSRLGVHAAA